MRITIHIDEATESASTAPPSASPPADASYTAAVDDTSAAVVAERTGATNAGRAPTGPADSDGPAQPSVRDKAAATWTGRTDSAGVAPTDRG